MHAVSHYVIHCLLLLLICTGNLHQTYSQTVRPLNEEKREEVQKLEEMAELSTTKNQYKSAISSYNKIALIYWDAGNLNKAVDYFLKSVPLNNAINNLENVKKIYSNIGLIYTDMEELQPALEYFQKSLKIRRELGNKREIASGLIDVAYVMGLMADYRKANERLNEALKISTGQEYPRMTVNIYNQLSKNFNNIGNIKKSQEFREKYTSYQEHIDQQSIKQEYEQRQLNSEIERRKTVAERRADSIEYQLKQVKAERRQDSLRKLEQEARDSLLYARREDSVKQLRLNSQKQELEVQQAKIKQQEAQQRNQQLIIYSIAGGLVLGFFLLIVMYRSNLARKKANKALAEKNTEIEKKSNQLQEAYYKIEDQNIKITQSISYAQEIQKALFPPRENLKQFIPESFIFFQPVELVSGDFYWFKELDVSIDLYEEKNEYEQRVKANEDNNGFLPIKNNKLAISAVDCTGHGVPGAFMSMIGYNLLDEITQSGVSRSDRILRELHKGIRRTLKQDETNNRDGMDMSLCVINKLQETVEFSGAKNPLIYIQDGEAHVIKGDKVPVGGMQTEQERYFHQQTIKIDRPTWFYIFSDGYVDQFGGSRNRKFLLKNLKNLLLEIHQESMEYQEKTLHERLHEWMGNKENQIDDVLVIGFKLENNHKA